MLKLDNYTLIKIIFHFSGVYSEVVYAQNDDFSQYYCHPIPFKFAFGFLIYSWICLPFVLCCQCFICCSTILFALLPSEPEPRRETTEWRIMLAYYSKYLWYHLNIFHFSPTIPPLDFSPNLSMKSVKTTSTSEWVTIE